MSLKMVVGEDFPRAHWMLDDQPPFADYSGYERTATGPVVTNLLPAGNVESTNTFSPNDSQWTRTVDTSVFHSGTRSVRFNHNQSKSLSNIIASVYGAGHMPQLTILPSTKYGFGGWVRSNIGALVRLRTSWQNAAGDSTLLDRFSDYFTLTPNTWTYVYFESVSHSQSAKVWLGFEAYTPSGNAAATDFAWADDFFFVENPPAGVTSFDGSTPGASWTGAVNNSPSTIPLFTLVPQYGTSLAKGASRSLIVSDTRKLTVDTPVFKQGKEYLTFSVEAFVRPIFSDPANIAEQQIWGNDGVMDGLTINGTVVSFVTKYTDGSEARASFDLMDDQSFAAVGIHTDRKNILYINGEQVAEAVITPEQKLSTFVATGENQSCGASTAPNSLMMNSLSVYDLELDEESALTHYANAQDVLGAQDIAIDYKGALLEFAPEGQLAPFFQIEYSSDAEWQLGTRVNCAINDGTLYPSVSQGVSVPGYWETVVPLGASENQIYAANLIWEGVGATVTTSRDGELYEPAQKGKALTTIPKGTNGENEFLFIRVAFEGGMANDPSFFDNMVFSLYTTGTISNFSGREVVLDKATPEDDLDVIDFQENWGVELEGGTVTIKAPVGDMGIKARTIEVWGLKNGTWANNLGAANRVRTNGGEAQPWRTGEWQLFHYVFDADFTGDIVFSGTGQIGHVVLYPEALSDAVIKEIYDCYTGKPKIQVEVDEVFDVHEFPGAVDIYEYDWSIESSG